MLVKLRFAAVSVALAALSLVLFAVDGLPDTPRARAQEAVSPEQQLADKFVPIVYVKNQRTPCDTRGSPYHPVEVDFLFNQPAIRLRQHNDGRSTDVKAPFDGSDLYGKDGTHFIDYPGNAKRPGCIYERDFLARADDYAAVAYANIAYQDGREGFALQYWLFYYFNHWNNHHEGDWELVQLTFEGPTPADALAQDQQPTGVGYSQHAGGERGAWDDDKLRREGDHPVTYAAAGANANQFGNNIILGRGENGSGFGCDDASPPNRRVMLEARLLSLPTGPDSEYAWLGFEGRWGERQPWEFNGPTGPNMKRAWREPFSWQEDLRPRSITVPGRDTIGPNGVRFFCDAVWYLSTPLATLMRVPPMLLFGGGVALFAGLGYVATRTSYLPVRPVPLRRARAFGQVMTTAARIYRQNLLLFLGIGLLFIPAGLVESAIHWLLTRTPWLDTVTNYFSNSLAVEAAIAIALGNVASSIVYWFVVVTGTVAISNIERGRLSTAFGDYRDMLRRFFTLAVPRLKALGILILLSISVIGIPWAIRYSIQWSFIEESIVLDDVPSDQARRASSETVHGYWWRTFFALTALWAIAYILGPLIAFTLLFVSPLSLALINLTASIVFAAIAPYVAICRALIYFDLHNRKEAGEAPRG